MGPLRGHLPCDGSNAAGEGLNIPDFVKNLAVRPPRQEWDTDGTDKTDSNRFLPQNPF
ncbi:MAG TPA: hypothetical protein PKE69_21455 [Pyrinomonadaceae bacterium]|nr:hypothetical protein [Pyrinomonadaceae bacterium]